MANLSGSDFYDYVLRVFKRTDKETEVYEAITDAIQYWRVETDMEEDKTISLVTGISTLGDYKLALPTDFGDIIGDLIFLDVGNGDGSSCPLTKLTKAEYDEVEPYPSVSNVSKGIPQYYCIYGEEIYISPVPDNVGYQYNLNYTVDNDTITSSSTSVPFTDKYRKTLRQLVLSELYTNLDMDNEAAKYKVLGQQGIEQITSREDLITSGLDTVAYNDI